MSQESYIDMFYPERFISLEGNELRELKPVGEVIAHEQQALVRWLVFWDGLKQLELYAVTKDGLTILQDRRALSGKTKRTAQKHAKQLIPSEGYGEWANCPILVYHGSRYSYKFECYYPYGVFWNGHGRFLVGSGEEWYEEEREYEKPIWFYPNVGGYALQDYDDDLGYIDMGMEIDIPDTRSDYADAPEGLISTASNLVDYEAKGLDVASAAQVFDELSNTELGGCIGGLFVLLSAMVGFFIKFIVYALIGLIIFNIINVFTGWFDGISEKAFQVLWVAGAAFVWGAVSLTRLAWDRVREKWNV